MKNSDTIKTWIIAPTDDSTTSVILRIKTSYERTYERDQNGAAVVYIRPFSQVSLRRSVMTPRELYDHTFENDRQNADATVIDFLHDDIDTLKFLQRTEILACLTGCDRASIWVEHCKLTSLVGLPRNLKIEDLNVSNNNLTDLVGIPKRIRSLNADDNPNLTQFNCDADEIRYIRLRKTGIKDLTGLHNMIRDIGYMVLSASDAFLMVPRGLMDAMKAVRPPVSAIEAGSEAFGFHLRLNWESANRLSKHEYELVSCIGDKISRETIDDYILTNYLSEKLSKDVRGRLDNYSAMARALTEVWRTVTNRRTQLMLIQKKLIETGWGDVL